MLLSTSKARSSRFLKYWSDMPDAEHQRHRVIGVARHFGIDVLDGDAQAAGSVFHVDERAQVGRHRGVRGRVDAARNLD